ncbi:hypothetical protein ABPG72_013368 [Tetrahymena utriculariae]
MKYVIGIEWSFEAMIGSSFGDVYPPTEVEIFFTIISMVTGEQQTNSLIIQYNLEDETSKGQQERIDQDINIEQFSEYDQKFNYFQDFKLINNNNTVKNLVNQLKSTSNK